MLQLDKVSKAFGARPLLAEVTWHVGAGDRVGLTGPNGAGKTTLLRIVAGLEPPDAGAIRMPRGTRVGYLPQDGVAHRGRTVREEALRAFDELLALKEEQRRLEDELARLDPSSPAYERILDRYGECQERWARGGGFEIEPRVAEVLAGLGFAPDEIDRPAESFSGGWQMRIALARLLLERPGLLLLDEPTNHLDLEARNWLEDYLASYPYAVVLVSHDRFFLDRVVTRITEIDRARLVDYPGNYSDYLERREAEIAELRARAAEQERERERIQRFIDRFRYKATKAAQVQSRIKMLEKMPPIEVPPERKRIRFRLPPAPRTGRVVVALESVVKRYGEKEVFGGVDLIVERGDRLALVGPNGAGKSTLSRLLAGVEAPDAGVVRLGHNVRVGYFGQDRTFDLDEEATVYENAAAVAPVAMVPRLRNLLGAFLFRGDDVDKKVKVLSGGEKSRLALARLLLRPASLLVLDEPTNHLDLDSKEVLLDALRAFDGTLVFVSHDRYFIDALATKVAAVGGGGLRVYPGNYEDFLRLAEGATQEAPPRPPSARRGAAPAAPPRRAPRGGRSKNEKRRLREERERLERHIEETETAVASLEGRMSVPGFYDDPAAAADIVKTHEALRRELEELYRRWEELAAEPA